MSEKGKPFPPFFVKKRQKKLLFVFFSPKSQTHFLYCFRFFFTFRTPFRVVFSFCYVLNRGES